VIDGDTIRVRQGTRRHTVRLLGIDTPEVFGGRECGGREASTRMKRLAPRGRKVRVTGDPTQPKRDRYGRLLAYVKTSGGTDLSIAQLRAGRATVLVVGKPFTRIRPYTLAAIAAKGQARGVWGMCGGDFHRPV